MLLNLTRQDQVTCETGVSPSSIFRRINTNPAVHWLALYIMGDFLVGQDYKTMEDHQNLFMIMPIEGVSSEAQFLVAAGTNILQLSSML